MGVFNEIQTNAWVNTKVGRDAERELELDSPWFGHETPSKMRHDQISATVSSGHNCNMVVDWQWTTTCFGDLSNFLMSSAFVVLMFSTIHVDRTVGTYRCVHSLHSFAFPNLSNLPSLLTSCCFFQHVSFRFGSLWDAKGPRGPDMRLCDHKRYCMSNGQTWTQIASVHFQKCGFDDLKQWSVLCHRWFDHAGSLSTIPFTVFHQPSPPFFEASKTDPPDRCIDDLIMLPGQCLQKLACGIWSGDSKNPLMLAQ